MKKLRRMKRTFPRSSHISMQLFSGFSIVWVFFTVLSLFLVTGCIQAIHYAEEPKSSPQEKEMAAVERSKAEQSEVEQPNSEPEPPEEAIPSLPPHMEDQQKATDLDVAHREQIIAHKHPVPPQDIPDQKPAMIEDIPETPPEPLETSPIEDTASPLPKPEKKTDQELLDSALEFCQASYDFWQRGELENALEALDQAYSLILKVNVEKSPEVLQQREDLRFTISKRIIEVYSSRFTVANGYHKVIPLVMNAHVEKAIRLLQGQERGFFLASYRRSGKYRPAIIKALKEAGLPEELSWLPLIESGYKVTALSRARALGLWQFIASTGYKYGLKRDHWVDERMDPEKSTQAAIAYLKELHQIFGDWATVLAGYNCGEGRVLKCIRTQKINYLDHFWDLYDKLPSETAFYYPKFLAVLHIINDPEAHGFNLPPVDDPLESETVTITKQVHLKTIAGNLEVSYDVMRELNPELRHSSTPPTPYALKVPEGKGATLLSKIDDIPTWRPPVPAYVRHRVRSGETLSVIARRYRTSVQAIMTLNGLRSSHYIKAGWTLKIPTRRTYAGSPSPRPASAPVPEAATGKPQKYVVRKGDSLWKIAQRFGTTAKAIQTANALDDTRLQIEQVLDIRPNETGLKEVETKTYKVLRGDSPYSIASKHAMNLSDFLRINNLTPRSTIFPGQTLVVRDH